MSSLRELSPTEVLIEKLVPGADGLARIGAQVVFVKGGLPGERLLLGIAKKRRGVHSAEISKILTSSEDRVVPPCVIHGQCGGCQLQHMSYDGQLLQKREILKDALQRIGKIDIPEIGNMVPSPQPFWYRSTIRFVVFKDMQGFKLGFYQAETRTPVEAKTCWLIPEHIQRHVDRVAKCLATIPSLPLYLEHVEFRASIASSNVLIVFHGTYKKVEQVQAFLEQFHENSGVVGCIAKRPGPRGERKQTSPVVIGQDHLIQKFDDLTLHVGFQSFTQTNWSVYETIGQTLKSWVGGVVGLRVLEIYAGTGALGMSLARLGAYVTLVEANVFALEDARKSVALSRVARCKFKKQTGERFLPAVKKGEYDVILVDPPRTGLSQKVADELGRIGASRVYYVSCDVATLARDLARLATHRYRVVRIQPFDMFPQTAHIETLIELTL